LPADPRQLERLALTLATLSSELCALKSTDENQAEKLQLLQQLRDQLEAFQSELNLLALANGS
jgi:hypothetical protein